MQPDQSGVESPKVLCDDPENVKGILSYRECDYTKDANAKPVPVSEPSGMGLPSNAAFGSQSWLSVDQQMPMLTPNSGSLYDKAGHGNGSGRISSFGDVNGGESTESPDGQSNGRTPNSSNGSDARMAAAKHSGASLFSTGASPQFSNHTGFFGVAQPSYEMQPQPQPHQQQQSQPQPQQQQQQHMGNQSLPYGMTTGWETIAAQQAANIQNEGVLRALMNMGPMEAMDLSSWDTGNEPMRG